MMHMFMGYDMGITELTSLFVDMFGHVVNFVTMPEGEFAAMAVEALTTGVAPEQEPLEPGVLI